MNKGTYQINPNLPIILNFLSDEVLDSKNEHFIFFILFLEKNIWSMNHFFLNEHSGYFWINEIYSSMDFLRK